MWNSPSFHHSSHTTVFTPACSNFFIYSANVFFCPNTHNGEKYYLSCQYYRYTKLTSVHLWCQVKHPHPKKVVGNCKCILADFANFTRLCVFSIFTLDPCNRYLLLFHLWHISWLLPISSRNGIHYLSLCPFICSCSSTGSAPLANLHCSFVLSRSLQSHRWSPTSQSMASDQYISSCCAFKITFPSSCVLVLLSP